MKATVTYGERIRNWGGWYRHDTYSVDGKPLEGFVQVKTNGRGGHEAITCYGDGCVMGRNLGWLLRQNGIQAPTHNA